MSPPPYHDLLDVVRASTSAADLEERLERGAEWAAAVLQRHDLLWTHEVGWRRLLAACLDAATAVWMAA